MIEKAMSAYVNEASVCGALLSSLRLLLTSGECVRPQGVGVREIRNLSVSIRNPRTRFVEHSSIHYPLIALRQFLIVCDTGADDIVSRAAVMGRAQGSAAAKYDDLNKPGIFKKLRAISDLLQRDSHSRQAVLNLEYAPDNRGRLPITLSLQFFVRNGQLEATSHLRSNDLWNGFLTDVLMLAFLQELVADQLKVEVGTYTHIVGSAHVYDTDVALAEKFLERGQAHCTAGSPPPIFQFDDCGDVSLWKENVMDRLFEGPKVRSLRSLSSWRDWCDNCIDMLTEGYC